MRAICEDRPRLNPVKFPEVMNILRAYEWGYIYSNSLGTSEIYHRPRKEPKFTARTMHTFSEGVDYFLSQDAVIEFVKDQITARGRDFQELSDKALFFPMEDMLNDGTDLLDAVADEDFVKLKLPTGALYQSTTPYESQFDRLTTGDDEDIYSDIQFDSQSIVDDEEEEDDGEEGSGQEDGVEDEHVAGGEHEMDVQPDEDDMLSDITFALQGSPECQSITQPETLTEPQFMDTLVDNAAATCSPAVGDHDVPPLFDEIFTDKQENMRDSQMSRNSPGSQSKATVGCSQDVPCTQVVEDIKDVPCSSQNSQNSLNSLNSQDSQLTGQKRKVSPEKRSSLDSSSSKKRVSPGIKGKAKSKSKSIIVPGSSIKYSASKPASVSNASAPPRTPSNSGSSSNSNSRKFSSETASSPKKTSSPKKVSPKKSPKSSEKKKKRSNSLSPKEAVSPSQAAEVVTGPPSSTLGDTLQRVKGRLQASYTPPSVLHREAEYEQILSATMDSFRDRTGTTIRVAGQPGQGKTMTVKHLIAALKSDVSVEKFSSVFLRGSDFQGGGYRYVERELGLEVSTCEENAQIAVTKYFHVSKLLNAEMILFVIDEIDMLPAKLSQQLLKMVKNNSRVVLIGLANDPSVEEYDTEVIFEVYSEQQILGILNSLTENLIDPRGALMIAKTATAEGDIRPMTNLALACFEYLENQKANCETWVDDLLQPASAVVTLGVVSKAKAEFKPMDMKEKLLSVSKEARVALVSLALQHIAGDYFTFKEMLDLVNTHVEGLQLPRCDGAEVESRRDELINSSFISAVQSSKTVSSSLQRYVFCVSASDLLQENCRDVLLKQNWAKLEEVVRLRQNAEKE